jgi:hypothetical protein
MGRAILWFVAIHNKIPTATTELRANCEQGL